MNLVLGEVRNSEAYLMMLWPTLYIFDKLEGANISLNLTKCEFGKATVTSVAKQVGRDQMCTVDTQIEGILEYAAPTTRPEIIFAEYYHRFCRTFAAMVSPLTSLASRKWPFVWSAVSKLALESCKALI